MSLFKGLFILFFIAPGLLLSVPARSLGLDLVPHVAVSQNASAIELAHVDPALLEALDAAIQEDPDNVSAYMQRGLLFNHLEEEGRAIADFSQVIRLAPENPDAYNFRGTLYYRQKQLDKALADFERAIAIAPDFAVLYFNRAYVRRDLGDIAGAIADFTQGANLAEQQGDTQAATEAREIAADLAAKGAN